jgi:gliding motility-associated-like protein
MKYLLSFLALFLSCSAIGQYITISDTAHCNYISVAAEVTGGTVPTSSGITADDNWSAVFPIGFTFDFYGTPNTQCIIGSNGCLGFDLANALAYNTWPINNTLLGSTGAAPDVVDCICVPWCDVYIPAGGTIQYSMVGTAPNREFEVTWCGTAMYSCTTQWLTTQVILYETSNIVEVHIGHHTYCTSWNGGYAIVGVKNAAGTSAVTAPGRDYPANWNATDEAWRFTPVAGPTYSVTAIPYNPIPIVASAVYWYDSSTGAYISSGPSISVTPSVTTTYTACVLSCSDTTKAYIRIDPSTVYLSGGGGIPHIDTMTYTSPTVCGKCDGSITLHGLMPHLQDSVFYSFNGAAQPILVDSTSVDSTITLSNLCAGTYDHIYVKVLSCPSNSVGPVTLAAPPLGINLDYSIKYGCHGDKVQFINNSTPVGVPYLSHWNFTDTAGSYDTSDLVNPVAIYYPQGIYTVSFTYSTIYGCAVDTTFPVTLLHPLDPGFTTNFDTVCLGTPIVYTNTTTSPNMPTYSWNYGDGSPVDTTTNPTHTYLEGGDYQTILTVTDTIGCDSMASEYIRVVFITAHTSVADTSVCLSDSLILHTLYSVVPQNDDSLGFQWSAANNLGALTNPTASFMGIGTFTYTFTATAYPSMIQVPAGCSASDTERINSYPPVNLINLTQNQAIMSGGSVQLNADGAVYYTWKPDNGTLNNTNINNPIATPTDSITVYTVSGMNYFGCLDSATITIKVVYDSPDDMPTAFTPNGDGLNDVFKLTNLKYQKLVAFSIYNRLGQKVFSTSNPESGWDGTYNGTPQDMGVYYYQVIISHPDGTNAVYKGDVTLIR